VDRFRTFAPPRSEPHGTAEQPENRRSVREHLLDALHLLLAFAFFLGALYLRHGALE